MYFQIYKKITNILIAFSFSSSVAYAATPTCSNPIGEWKNQLGSTLTITSMDKQSGKLTGSYRSPSGTNGKNFELLGWINANPGIGKDIVTSIAFSVQWRQIGSITSWTGTCVTDTNGVAKISTIWNLTRSTSNFSWDHILTNTDVFIPNS